MNISSARASQDASTKGFAFKNPPLCATNSTAATTGKRQGFSVLKTVKQLSAPPQAKLSIHRPPPKSSSPIPPEDFKTKIYREFIEGSGIAPGLFHTTIAFISDHLALPGGEFDSPLCEAFNWKYQRFGHQARQYNEAAVFLNEDRSVWQGKLDRPRTDKKGKVIKYETPVGNGSQPYLPYIDQETRQAIAHRYNVEVPPPGGRFWTWVIDHPEIPIILTEGGKKALCLLSQGYVAISLYGVDGGARTKNSKGKQCKPYLIPELTPFTSKGRPIILAFDQDAEAKTRLQVERAIFRLARLLKKAGCSTSVATWDGRLGKGVDDLIVNQGPLFWHDTYQAALPFQEWIARRKLLRQLTYTPDTIVYASDLSLITFNHLPEQGILAIHSAKGTGKTKLIGQLAEADKKALVATHRICLGRNLCNRIGVHWRGDLDKANGDFIHGAGYALRVGFCVDSLLAISPEKFAGCVLIVDEVVQVMRHLLTSTTCRKDGKLPILLARLRELIQHARLVIVADADLDNATLNYVKALRGDNQPIHLIQNQTKPEGYPCEFMVAPNASGTIARLLQAISQNQRIFVATDSKKQSKHLADQCHRVGLKETEVLLINSETSGGEQEQAFINDPDRFLDNHPQIRVVIASPSLTTGASIESQFFDQVFGLFWGASLTDADIAQGLMRVRDAIPRTVWCAQMGRNFCSFSRSTRSGDIIHALKTRTDTATGRIRPQLREDVCEVLTTIDWSNDPHIRLFAQIIAATNAAMWNLRSALLARLRLEGHQITIVDLESDPIIQAAMKESRHKIRQLEAEAIAAAPLLTATERLQLESQEYVTPAEQLSLIKTALADFYCTNEITPELVLDDKAGLRRSRLLALEHQLYPETAQQRDIQALEKQMQWYKGICPWDIAWASTKREARLALGLDRYLNPDYRWTDYDNKLPAQRARECAEQVKLFLGLGNLHKISDTQIVHQLLSQLGLKVTYHWSSKVPGHEGEKLRVYQLDAAVWNENLTILNRRAVRRQVTGSALAGSPPSLDHHDGTLLGGDPAKPDFSADSTDKDGNPVPLTEKLDTPQPLSPFHSPHSAWNREEVIPKSRDQGG